MLKYIIALFTASFALLVLFVYLAARMYKELRVLTATFASATTYGFGMVLTLTEFLS